MDLYKQCSEKKRARRQFALNLNVVMASIANVFPRAAVVCCQCKSTVNGASRNAEMPANADESNEVRS